MIAREQNIIETLSLQKPCAVSLRWSLCVSVIHFFLLSALFILLLSFSRSWLSVVSGASVPPSFTLRLACLPPSVLIPFSPSFLCGAMIGASQLWSWSRFSGHNTLMGYLRITAPRCQCAFFNMHSRFLENSTRAQRTRRSSAVSPICHNNCTLFPEMWPTLKLVNVF